MITTPRLALALALGLAAISTACGSDPAHAGDGPGGDGPGPGSDQPPRPLDPTGMFAMHSTFDLATNMPGTAGDVVKSIIDATDDDDDPTRWIVDQLIGTLDDGLTKSAANFVKEAVVSTLNNELLSVAPDFLSTAKQLGSDFGTIAKNFGLDETLALSGSGGNYTAVHSIVGVHYQLGNQQGDLLLANYHLTDVVVPNVAVTMDQTGQLTIAAHSVPLAYGQVLRLGLDAAIIPMLDSTARNLGDLLNHHVDCAEIGNVVSDAIKNNNPFHITVAPSAIEKACVAGLNAGASLIYNQIAQIDGNALTFSINGTARAVDKNNDRQIDAIQTGTWAGTLAYGATPTPLIPAAFSGERM
jgi:hypothetical protein